MIPDHTGNPTRLPSHQCAVSSIAHGERLVYERPVSCRRPNEAYDSKFEKATFLYLFLLVIVLAYHDASEAQSAIENTLKMIGVLSKFEVCLNLRTVVSMACSETLFQPHQTRYLLLDML